MGDPPRKPSERMNLRNAAPHRGTALLLRHSPTTPTARRETFALSRSVVPARRSQKARGGTPPSPRISFPAHGSVRTPTSKIRREAATPAGTRGCAGASGSLLIFSGDPGKGRPWFSKFLASLKPPQLPGVLLLSDLPPGSAGLLTRCPRLSRPGRSARGIAQRHHGDSRLFHPLLEISKPQNQTTQACGFFSTICSACSEVWLPLLLPPPSPLARSASRPPPRCGSPTFTVRLPRRRRQPGNPIARQ